MAACLECLPRHWASAWHPASSCLVQDHPRNKLALKTFNATSRQYHVSATISETILNFLLTLQNGIEDHHVFDRQLRFGRLVWPRELRVLRQDYWKSPPGRRRLDLRVQLPSRKTTAGDLEDKSLVFFQLPRPFAACPAYFELLGQHMLFSFTENRLAHKQSYLQLEALKWGMAMNTECKL